MCRSLRTVNRCVDRDYGAFVDEDDECRKVRSEAEP
jgi:hypothetical protein